MNRPLLAVAVATGILGLVLMASLAPDTGPPVAPAVRTELPVEALPPRPGARPNGARPNEARATGVAPDEGLPVVELDDDDAGLLPPRRRPEALPPIDPDQVFPAELRGLASAAVSRREAYQACWDALGAAGGDADYSGRLTVRITVSPEDDRGVASTEVVNGPEDPGFQDCMAGVLSDAKFEAPAHDFTMMWPVPIRTEQH